MTEPKFRSREEYERWKAERAQGASALDDAGSSRPRPGPSPDIRPTGTRPAGENTGSGPLRFGLRGAVAFGLASVPAALGLVRPWFILGFVASGVVGGTLLGWARGMGRSAVAAGVGFGLGFLIPALLIPFSLISLGQLVDPAWGAVAWGIGLGWGGAVGAPFLRSRVRRVGFGPLAFLVAAGGLGFGCGGAMGGAIGFSASEQLGEWGLALGLVLAYVTGGALLGGAAGFCEQPRAQALVEGRARAERSGLAVMAAVLGALGLLLALAYPGRFRLPRHLVLFFLVPVTTLGIRGVSAQASFLLGVAGLPAHAVGLVALRQIRRSRGNLGGGRAAVGGAAAGALLVLAATLLMAPPIARRFEVRYARAQLASVRGQERAYGNVAHEANILLGQVALREGDLATATRYLVEAGKTPGSPPDLALAKALVERGQRDAVIEYLRLCAKFWKGDEGRLEEWASILAAGGSPALDWYAAAPWVIQVVEARGSGDVLAYGPQGPAPRHPEPTRTWLALLIEVGAPLGRRGLTAREMAVADEAGATYPVVAIAAAPADGSRPKFLFLDEALGAWKDDPPTPSSVSVGYYYNGGQRSEVVLMFPGNRLLVTITRAGLVNFPSEPTRLFLLFAPPASAKPSELRFGKQTRPLTVLGPPA